MATVNITYPDAYAADILESLKVYLGGDAAGLTNVQVVNKALNRFVMGLVLARRKVLSPTIAAVVSATNIAIAAAETTAAEAIAARKAAEAAEDLAVRTAFGGV